MATKKKSEVPQMVELGDKAKDAITGQAGIVNAITDFLYGCRRIAIAPQVVKDGKPVEMFVIDDPQTVVVEKQAIKPVQPAEQTVQLGDRVKDQISVLGGIVVGITNFLHGSRRIAIQPETTKDGCPAPTFVADEAALKIVKKAVIKPFAAPVAEEKKPKPRSHGPREDFIQRPSLV